MRMMNGTEINWEEQLNRLPDWARSGIVTLRLVGMVGVIVALVGVYIAKDIGALDDAASRSRLQLVQDHVILQQKIDKMHDVLVKEIDMMQAHIKSTNAIARGQCLIIPNLSDRERRECMNGVD